MKNYRDGDYAANKYARGIVYKFADKTVEITPEDYLRENPGKTEADFAELKVLSDGMYETDDRAEYRATWKDVSIHDLEETVSAYIPSAEHEAIDTLERAVCAERRRKAGHNALAALTETQRRRYLMYHVEGKTEEEIADIEGVIHQAISKSLLGANRKIMKFLAAGKNG